MYKVKVESGSDLEDDLSNSTNVETDVFSQVTCKEETVNDRSSETVIPRFLPMTFVCLFPVRERTDEGKRITVVDLTGKRNPYR